VLLHDAERHEKCPCIPSSVYATAPRKCRNQEQNHPFCERMSEVATTGDSAFLPQSDSGRSENPFRLDAGIYYQENKRNSCPEQ